MPPRARPRARIGDRQARAVRLEGHATILPLDFDGLRERERSDDRVLALETGCMKEAHEGEGGSVDDRDFGAFDFDQAVVQADARRRRQDVLHCADGDAVTLEGGRKVERSRRFEPGRNHVIGVVPPDEDQPVVDRGRPEIRLDGMSRMKTDPLY